MAQNHPRNNRTLSPAPLVVGSTFGAHYVRGLAHPGQPPHPGRNCGARLHPLTADGSRRRGAFYPLPDAPTNG